MLILGVDPGLRATGYGLVDGSAQGVRLIDAGVIRTEDEVPLAHRLHAIHESLEGVVSRHAPDAVAVEDLYAAPRYPRTAILMGHVRGVVCQAAAAKGIEVVALPPAAVKHAVAGFGAASKDQVQLAVQRVLGLPAPLEGHAADAVAMALVALSRRGVPLRSAAAEPAAAQGGV
ncbi:MAG: crossover junction endodeoxyribonuclease RuvC [Armatimonadetes bacterium]|nr:crossover junction endodeoxyribonuclease RuvC [Armatimonadota bacterium]